MIDSILWIIVILGYSLSIFIIIRTFVFAKSLFRDAPYVPVNRQVAQYALELLELKQGDNFVDIGSGDGIVVFEAAKIIGNSGSVTGIEAEKPLIFWCNLKKRLFKNSKNINFINGDIFKQEYSKYNKVFMYLTTDLTNDIAQILLKQLPKGSIVVTVMFKYRDKFLKKKKVIEKSCKIGSKEWKLYIWKK